MMDPLSEHLLSLTRRHFFRQAGLGAAALWTLLQGETPARAEAPAGLPHFAPRAKRVIYLSQSGAPSQLALFDHKPRLAELRGKELPDSIRRGQRLTGMPATQESSPLAPSQFRFARHGKCGAWV